MKLKVTKHLQDCVLVTSIIYDPIFPFWLAVDQCFDFVQHFHYVDEALAFQILHQYQYWIYLYHYQTISRYKNRSCKSK